MKKTNYKFDVFISCSIEDLKNTLLLRLISDLTDAGFETWIAQDAIKSGDSLIDEISNAISESRYMLCIISRHTNDSLWIGHELRLATSTQVGRKTNFMMPIRIDDSAVPELFRNTLYLDLTDYENAKNLLFSSLDEVHLERLAEFTVDKFERGSSILQVSNEINNKLIEYLLQNPTALHSFDRRRFEELIAMLFDGFGYEVELTKQTRDGGRDIVAVKNREVKVKYLIECKRPDKGNKISVSAVRELFAVKTDEGATKGILATTAFFTKDALLWFDRHPWELEPRDHNGILEWISTYIKERK